MKFKDKKHHPVSESFYNELMELAKLDHAILEGHSEPFNKYLSVVHFKLNEKPVIILRGGLRTLWRYVHHGSLEGLYKGLSKEMFQELDEDGYIIVIKEDK